VARRSTPAVGPRIGLWGAGMISGAHGAAATFLQMPIVGVASRTVERAAQQAERLSTVAMSYADLPGSAEIVVVSTPPQMHAADTLRLLEAGAAVVVEKPLCTTLADADALVAAAAANGQRVLYAENLAYAPVVRELIAQAGRLGPLTHLEIRTLQTLPTWGDFTSDEWGGGALFDLGVHPLALAVLSAAANGAGPVISVRATLRDGAGHNSDEHAEVELTFRSGLVGRVISSWQNESGQTWDVQLSSATGVLRAEFWPTPTLERDGEPVPMPTTTMPIAFIEDLGYVAQLQDFADDIARGRTPFMDVQFGRLILDIVCAAYWSAGHGSVDEAVPFTGARDKTPLQLWHGT
jgi:myo-inositol 2-dehydrogenase/D-chiro-inositol 1-dehydrogenase